MGLVGSCPDMGRTRNTRMGAKTRDGAFIGFIHQSGTRRSCLILYRKGDGIAPDRQDRHFQAQTTQHVLALHSHRHKHVIGADQARAPRFIEHGHAFDSLSGGSDLDNLCAELKGNASLGSFFS